MGLIVAGGRKVLLARSSSADQLARCADKYHTPPAPSQLLSWQCLRFPSMSCLTCPPFILAASPRGSDRRVHALMHAAAVPGLMLPCRASASAARVRPQPGPSALALHAIAGYSQGLAVHCRQARVSCGVWAAAGHIRACDGFWTRGRHRCRHPAGCTALCIQASDAMRCVEGRAGGRAPARLPQSATLRTPLPCSYSKVTMTAFTVVPSRSGAVRTFDQRTVLDMFAGRITAVSLSGYLFFGRWGQQVEGLLGLQGRPQGASIAPCTTHHLCCTHSFLPVRSSVSVVERVVGIAQATLDSQPHLQPQPATQQPQQRPRGGAPLLSLPSSGTLLRTYDNVDQFVDTASGGLALAVLLCSYARLRRMQRPPVPSPSHRHPPTHPPLLAASAGEQLSNVAAALAESPRFLILDFRRVQGLDATAARSFVTLHNKLQRMDIQVGAFRAGRRVATTLGAAAICSSSSSSSLACRRPALPLSCGMPPAAHHYPHYDTQRQRTRAAGGSGPGPAAACSGRRRAGRRGCAAAPACLLPPLRCALEAPQAVAAPPPILWPSHSSPACRRSVRLAPHDGCGLPALRGALLGVGGGARPLRAARYPAHTGAGGRSAPACMVWEPRSLGRLQGAPPRTCAFPSPACASHLPARCAGAAGAP